MAHHCDIESTLSEEEKQKTKSSMHLFEVIYYFLSRHSEWKQMSACYALITYVFQTLFYKKKELGVIVLVFIVIPGVYINNTWCITIHYQVRVFHYMIKWLSCGLRKSVVRLSNPLDISLSILIKNMGLLILIPSTPWRMEWKFFPEISSLL